MNISDFRYKIFIQLPTATKDEYGAESIVYTTIYTLKAGKKSLGGSKGIDANEVFTSNNLVFETHYRSGITDECIVLYDDKKYKINQITEIGFKIGLQITVEKINE